MNYYTLSSCRSSRYCGYLIYSAKTIFDDMNRYGVYFTIFGQFFVLFCLYLMCVIIFDSLYIPTTKDHSIFVLWLRARKCLSVNGLTAQNLGVFSLHVFFLFKYESLVLMSLCHIMTYLFRSEATPCGHLDGHFEQRETIRGRKPRKYTHTHWHHFCSACWKKKTSHAVF